MVIEEPQAPEPATTEVPSEETSAPKREAPPRRRVNANQQPSTEESTPETPAPPPVPVPALEPRQSPQQQTELRSQVVGWQGKVQQRIGQLEHSNLADTDRRTLEDAKTFLSQSQKALEDSDLQRALNLALKASLLVGALERH